MSEGKERSEAGKALFELGMEVVHTYFRLRAAAEKIGADTPAGAGSLGLLRSLAVDGPQPVPQLARERQVTRQHIQTMVNELAEQGLVEFTENPAHKRSKLVAISRRGETRLKELIEKIENAYEEVSAGMDPVEIRTATKILSELRHRAGAM
jgi:DNA-binding MarR family transcriptional regulator